MKITVVRLLSRVFRYPLITAVAMMAVYFAVFQLPFITTGDVWAEAYMEYLHKALGADWIAVFMPSWEGYVTLLPSFFTKLFVESGASLGNIDLYFRAITVAFTIASLAVIASPLTKPLLPRLWQRLVVILALLLTLWHVSALSFINIWYVGFVPVVVVALSAVKLNVWRQIAYTFFALLVAFTKPSVILAPFIIYRAIRTKEYISNGLILIAVALQTYLLFFATSSDARNITTSFWQIIHDMYVGCGTAVLKLLHIAPTDLLLACAMAALVVLVVLLGRWLGWVRASLLAFGFVFSVYAYVLAPTAGPQSFVDAGQLFADHYKIQREILISMFLVLSVGLLLPHAWNAVRKFAPRWRLAAKLGLAAVIIAGLALLYRPIDVASHQVSMNISPFRSHLDARLPVCMPVAPTPSWSPGTNWYLSSGGGCETVGQLTAATVDELQEPVSSGQVVRIAGHGQHSLMSVVVPVRLESPQRTATVVLTHAASGMRFSAQLRTTNAGGAQFVAFNTSGLPVADSYEFIVTTDVPAFVAFSNTRTVAVQAYFMLLKP